MSASQQCHARGYTRARYLVVFAMFIASAAANAGNELQPPPQPGCDVTSVVAHVQEQFRIYGPKSQKHEFFGFIYRVDGQLASAVIRGSECTSPDACGIDTGAAAGRIPHRAKILGEWHSHAHRTGSRLLSKADVRGAHQNAHIRCYSAYFAGPGGEIYGWDPASTSVPVAMATLTSLGQYDVADKSAPDAYLATVEGNPPTP